jgi:hypothetical protein
METYQNIGRFSLDRTFVFFYKNKKYGSFPQNVHAAIRISTSTREFSTDFRGTRNVPAIWSIRFFLLRQRIPDPARLPQRLLCRNRRARCRRSGSGCQPAWRCRKHRPGPSFLAPVSYKVSGCSNGVGRHIGQSVCWPPPSSWL